MIAKRCLTDDLSARAVEALVRQAQQAAGGSPKAKASQKSSDLRELEGNLGRLLGTKVEVRAKGKRGKLVVHFASSEHLDAVTQALDSAFRAAR